MDSMKAPRVNKITPLVTMESIDAFRAVIPKLVRCIEADEVGTPSGSFKKPEIEI